MDGNLKQMLYSLRNITLNATGVRRDFESLVADRDIDGAVALMQDRDREVDEAIREYNPETHDIMRRPDKRRRKAPDYRTEKLPRNRQRYINEVELFFLLGSPLVWRKKEGDDAAFELFKSFLESEHIHPKLRRLKRLAGAETEAALVFRLRRDDGGRLGVDSFIAARSAGYTLRPLFDQYGHMEAFAYGYTVKEGGASVRRWDIQTKDTVHECRRGRFGWEVRSYPNIAGKITAVYARQPKAWAGAEERLRREEFLDSKVADTNNYFADPIAAATADVVRMMAGREQTVGTFVQLTGPDSRFEYVNPPQNSEARRDEKADLERSILFDTFTPDFSLENMKGFGTLSGQAVTWQELVDRMRSVILAVLVQLHPGMKAALEGLKLDFSFPEPFESDRRETWQSVTMLYQGGLVSLDQAVAMLGLTDAPEEEVARITAAAREAMEAQMELRNGAPSKG